MKFTDVEQAVRTLANENPRAIYVKPQRLPEHVKDSVEQFGTEPPHCFYVHDGQEPGCIVGAALIAAGVSPEALYRFDRESGGSPAANVLRWLAVEGLDSRSERWIARVQEEQDGGATWSTAVLRADNPY